MNKIFKRLLSVVLALVMVVTLVPLGSAMEVQAATMSTGQQIYFDTNGDTEFTKDGAVPSVRFMTSASDNTNTWVTMKQVPSSDTIYYADVDKDNVTHVQFRRSDPDTGDDWNSRTSIVALDDENVCFRIANWNNASQQNSGTWVSYEGGQITESFFYVQTDLVDYLNDNRVNNNQVSGYYSDNQGNCTGNNVADNPYGYLNYAISQQGYDIPLYFGSLNYVKMRYGWNGSKQNLLNWNSGANIAPAKSDGSANYNASVQGLVGSKLDNGKLVGSNGEKLPYFSKDMANTLTASNGNKLMAYYSGLEFPFKAIYDDATQITTYSYDSLNDYAVYYDYSNTRLQMSDSHIKNLYDGENGYYPLNTSTDTGNNVNMGFGTKFTIPFTVNENGTITGLADGDPITFEFTGDDDVWVFIDGELVLDMGGAHTTSSGKIDFKNLSATVDNAYTVRTDQTLANADTDNISSYRGAGLDNWIYPGDQEERDKATSSSVTTDFPSDLKEKFTTEYQTGNTGVHTLTMFYMERGMYDSNMSISFTMNPIPSGLILSKDIEDDNINAGLYDEIENVDEFDFSLSATDLHNNTAVNFSKYSLTDHNNVSQTTTSDNGTITGVKAEKYAHSFRDADDEDAFVAGTGFTVTETIDNTIFTYDTEKTSWQVYDVSNNNQPVGKGGTGSTATFNMGTAESDPQLESYNYALNYTNTIKTSSLKLTKSYPESSADTEYEFTLKLDLDGEGTAFQSQAYEGVVYTSDKDSGGSTDENGKFTVKAGETVTFAGIPVGASYSIEETAPQTEGTWEIDSITGATQDPENTYLATGNISENESAVTFTNKSDSRELNKVIYVEAGKTGGTDYTIKDGENTVKVETAELNEEISSEEITVTVDGDGLNVNPTQANKTYEIEYSGKIGNDVKVNGIVTVYTYALTDDVYVFDYGLKSDLADTTYDNGMFQNDNLFIDGVDTTAKLTELDDSALTQSTITLEGNSSTPLDLEKYESTSGAKLKDNNKVIFEPTAFMDKQETATYGTTVYAPGKETVQSPEDGVVLSDADVKVMPANVVYYEDNFEGIEYTGSDSVVDKSEETSSLQSNANNTTHGYDIVYNGDNNDSDGTITTLTRTEDEIPTFSFKFKGSGFDIVGRTTRDTAVLTVMVEDIVGTNADGTPKTEVKSYGVVDTYYANGDLYQIPVISVRDLSSDKEHIVSVAVVKSSNEDHSGNDVFYLDGIRIYNPMQDTSEYQESEQNVKFENVHNLLVGDGNISEDVYRDEGAIIEVSAEGSKMVLVQYDEDAKKAVLYNGTSNTENQDGLEGDSIYSASLVDYLNKGPNNEVYLDPGVGIAFDITGENLTDINTIQIEAKKIDITSELEPTNTENAFSLMDNTGNLNPVNAKIESKTAMYYNIPLSSCIPIENGYRVILVANDTVSLSNIKYTENCSLNVPEVTDYLCKKTVTPEQDVYDAKIEKVTLSPTAKALRAKKSVSVTVQLDKSENFDRLNIYMIKDYNKVEECLTEDYLLESKSASKTNNYKFSFYAPADKGQYNLVIIPVNSDGEESCYYKSVAVTVK